MDQALVDLAGSLDSDGILLYTNGEHTISQPSFIEHFAGVTPIADNNALIVPAGSDPVFVVDLPRDVERIRRHTGVEDVSAADEFEPGVVSRLRELGLTESLGVGGADGMTHATYTAIAESVNEFESIDDRLVDLATEKDEEELAVFRMLGRIADAGFRKAYEVIRPGINEFEVIAEMEQEMRKRGSVDNFNLLSSGPHNQQMHAPTDRILRRGDTVILEITPMVDGLVLQLCRSVSVGPPGRTLIEQYGLLEDALARTKRAIGPGIAASVIPETMNGVFRAAGYGEYCEPPYMRTRGHEFGIGPLGMAITEDTETTLAEQMVLVVHPNQYLPETGYLALGDPILLTDGGFEVLTEVEPRLFVKEVL